MKKEIKPVRPEEHVCCICGRTFRGWGNNPVPVKQDGRCCDSCNLTYVLAERMKIVYGGKR